MSPCRTELTVPQATDYGANRKVERDATRRPPHKQTQCTTVRESFIIVVKLWRGLRSGARRLQSRRGRGTHDAARFLEVLIEPFRSVSLTIAHTCNSLGLRTTNERRGTCQNTAQRFRAQCEARRVQGRECRYQLCRSRPRNLLQSWFASYSKRAAA